MVTWRGFLALFGLAPAADVVHSRETFKRIIANQDGITKALHAENVALRDHVATVNGLNKRLQFERDALRAENDNLKRAAAETLIDEPPFGHVWERPRVWDNPSRRFVDPRSGTGLITVIGEPRITDDMIAAGIGQVDCLEGDKRRG